ncbi:MAG: cyanophycin synthetase [Tissierellia bacterium]|nr:cyanophycin synthetase [Tissierellia bacterium]
MKTIELRAIKGPNYYSLHPVIFMSLDIGKLEKKPSDLVPKFKENISSMIPSLYDHKCSPGRIGGFFERLERGTWAGHIVEHVAIELQCLAGYEVVFGKTFNANKTGVYNLVYTYLNENVGIRAGEMAVDIVSKVFAGELTEIEPLITELKAIGEIGILGPSTQSIVDEATKRGIPHMRLNEYSYVQLGYGVNQRRIQATMMDNTSPIGVEIADDKLVTKELLSSMGIPVAKGCKARSYKEVIKVADIIGYPVVLKPLIGNHGRGITINIKDENELFLAFNIASKVYKTVLIEKYLSGNDYRILVINGKFVSAALREPAHVVGDGISTIQDLVDEINLDPERGLGHEKNLTQITLDYMTERLLKDQNLTLNSIVAGGRRIYLKSTANLSSGGTAQDVTEKVHPENKAMAERISRIIGLNVIGIDIIAHSLEKPLDTSNSGVVEVNAAPGFRMHLNPTKGNSVNIASHIIDMLFPPKSESTIPIVAITGTNGKTTTTRIISHILSENGAIVGKTSTDSVVINNIPILKGDYSGPEGAKKVLMDSSIDHAVFEVARGGILRRGLGFKECDVGVLLNISSDHLGEGGIDTLEELTRLKSTVIEVVKPSGYAVLNADDDLVLSCLDKTKGKPILFSLNPNHPALLENLDKGNINISIIDNTLAIQEGENISLVAHVKDIPITFDGKASFNIENTMAAVAASLGLGLDVYQIRKGLLSFVPSLSQSQGRMNIIDMGEFKVVIDYGHNTAAINKTGDFIKSLMPGRIIRMSSSIGNRRDEDILDYGYALSKYYDHIVICDPDVRNKKVGETAKLVKQGLIKGGFKENMISTILDEREATKVILNMARPGDLIVLQVDNLTQVVEDVLYYKENLSNVIADPVLKLNI